MTFAMAGLVVNVGAMKDNLLSTNGLIVGEAIMMGLAPALGRQPAHDIVYNACHQSIDTGKPLLAVLRENDKIMSKIMDAELESLCDPMKYLGCCEAMVDSVLRAPQAEALENRIDRMDSPTLA
jgi:adenylosuccinate lyase